MLLIGLVSHAHIHNGQHHKDERLQRDNQNVEQGPNDLQRNTKETENQISADHNCDQECSES